MVRDHYISFRIAWCTVNVRRVAPPKRSTGGRRPRNPMLYLHMTCWAPRKYPTPYRHRPFERPCACAPLLGVSACALCLCGPCRRSVIYVSRVHSRWLRLLSPKNGILECEQIKAVQSRELIFVRQYFDYGAVICCSKKKYHAGR